MIIDFHVHVLPPEDMPAFTNTAFHRGMGALRTGKPVIFTNSFAIYAGFRPLSSS